MNAHKNPILLPEHRQHLAAELGEDGPDLALAHGVRSLSEQEAAATGFAVTGPDDVRRSSSGILFPFGDGFAQLRADSPPINAKGDPAKYLNRAGSQHDLAIIGTGDPTIATEGWKDAAALHLQTGETVAAIPGVSAWKLLPATVRTLVYDADAAQNPHVWGQLVRAGAARSALRLAFFDPDIAGAKGGACEYIKAGGRFRDLPQFKALDLLNHIVSLLRQSLRADYHPTAITAVVRGAHALDLSDLARAQILKRAAQRLRMSLQDARKLEQQTLDRIEREQAEAEGRDWQAEVAARAAAAEPETTVERCRALLAAIGGQWQADWEGRDRWRRWTGTHWVEEQGDDALLAEIEAFLDARNWQNRERGTILSLKDAFRRNLSNVPPEPESGLLPFRNGCLRLSDCTLLPHDPQHGNTWCLPFDYDGSASAPRIEAFLLDRLEDPAGVALFRAFAWHLLHGQRPKAFLEISGPSNTGKTILQNLLIALIGPDAWQAGTLERFEDRSLRFETIQFKGKRLAIFSEAQRYSGPLENLKNATGGDPIAAERKGSHASCSYVFHGGVLVTGNGPIRASDTSGAVINRRRSLFVRRVVAAGDERVLLEQARTGWRGELAPELPGLANWVLAMTEAEARAALARDVPSLSRIEAKLETLLETDHLAAWADECLVWDPAAPPASVGVKVKDPGSASLLSNYREWVEAREDSRPHGQRTFKTKLLDLLRDTLGLPLPPGSGSSGCYRNRTGSVIPSIRFRTAADGDRPGLIRHAVMAEAEAKAERIGDGSTPERDGKNPVGDGSTPKRDGKNPVGDGCDGWDGLNGPQTHMDLPVPPGPSEEEPDSIGAPHRESNRPETVPTVTSLSRKGFHRYRTVAPPPRSVAETVPEAAPTPVRVDGEPGWSLPGAWPKGNGPTVKVLLRDPQGQSRLIERGRIEVEAAA